MFIAATGRGARCSRSTARNPESFRDWVLLAVTSYLFKASPVWVLPLITANFVDLIAHRRAGGIHSLWLNAGIGAALILQNVPATFFYATFSSRAIRSVENRLRSALVRRLQMLSIAYHTSVNTGTLQTKVLRDVESVEQSRKLSGLLDIGVFAIVSILVALAVTAWRMPAFVPVFLLLVPILALIRYTMTGRLKRFNKNFRQQIEGMNAQVLGMINMIPVTRAHAAEDEAIARMESRLDNVSDAGQKFDLHAGLFGAVAWVSFMLFNLGVLVTGAWLSYRGTLPLTPGDLTLLTFYFSIIVNAVMQLNAMLPVITRGFDGLRSIGEVLECPDIEENRGKQPVTSVRGEFRFENVGFNYRGSPRGIPVPIPQGEDDAFATLREVNLGRVAGRNHRRGRRERLGQIHAHESRHRFPPANGGAHFDGRCGHEPD